MPFPSFRFQEFGPQTVCEISSSPESHLGSMWGRRCIITGFGGRWSSGSIDTIRLGVRGRPIAGTTTAGRVVRGIGLIVVCGRVDGWW